VDTVLLADAANPAATNRNQWYVAISRGRKRVVVFTSDKAELRANVQRSGERRLALELKPGASPQAEARRARVQQLPGWTRRAWATIQRLQQQRLVQHCQVQVHEALAVQRRLVIDHFQPRMQETPRMRIHL
jgi:serine acetyltransferase